MRDGWVRRCTPGTSGRKAIGCGGSDVSHGKPIRIPVKKFLGPDLAGNCLFEWWFSIDRSCKNLKEHSVDGENDPFDEGRRAAAADIPIEANPYPEGTEKNALWQSGHEVVSKAREAGGSEDS